MDNPALQKAYGYLFFRLILLFLVLVTALFQRLNPSVLNYSVEAVLGLSCFSFVMTTSFVFLIHSTKKIAAFVVSQVIFDILFTSALVYYTGVHESIFITFYFMNIMFSALLFSGTAALMSSLACGGIYFLLTSTFSENLSIERYYLVIITEISFIVVALLSGQFVDEIKRNRLKIGRLEKLNEDIIDSLDAGLIGLDKQKKVNRVNKTVLNIFGYLNSQNLLGKTLFEINSDLKDLSNLEVKEMVIKGAVRRILISGVELPDNGLMYLFRDVTEIMELEDKVRRNDHLASIGGLAASLAHEIRNPMASISGAAQILQGESTEESERLKLYELIYKETERVSGLVGQLLFLAKGDSGTKTIIDLRSLITECTESLRARPDFESSNVRILLNNASSTEDSLRFQVKANANQMKEVFLNLMLNSFQALSTLGAQDKIIKVSLKDYINSVSIFIEDNGPGVLKSYKHRIFDPFFTTKTYGTGLGLARVYKIIKDHDGKIECESDAENKPGTVFKISLPIMV